MDKEKEMIFENLESTINYYEALIESGHVLSVPQREQLAAVARRISVFGEYGDFLYHYVTNLLSVV